MGLIRSSSADVPHSTRGRISNEIIGVDIPVETGGTSNVVPIVSDDSDDYVLVLGVEEEIDSSDEEDELVSGTSSENDSGDEYDEEEESEDDIAEKMMTLADASKLKLIARNYLHPEDKIESNGITGRCFFYRVSAPKVISKEEADERAMILADAKALKAVAEGYLNPDLAIGEVDPTCFGKDCFAPNEEIEERDRILAEAIMLKKHVCDYLHPESKVTNVDATAFGRNYFSRASEDSSIEEAEERAEILSDAAVLKTHVVNYAHPEVKMVNSDSALYGKNYFSSCTSEESDERAQILAENVMLKKFAADYLHPGATVQNTDATSFGRNYFSSQAYETCSIEEAEERAKILTDAALLKERAVVYAHPEAPVISDPASFGRNYLTAFSEADDDEEERAQILAEVSMFKKLAIDYLHPETEVKNNDATLYCRNYYNRESAPQALSNEDEDECAQILADAAALKTEALSYVHPEAPVDVEATVFGRNYFKTRSGTDEEERAQVLIEASTFKQLATAYLHPEIKVKATDATLFGRNYFSTVDASEVTSNEEAEEQAQILADAVLLKKGAANYSHPETPLNVDATAFGRNYLTLSGIAEDEEERAQILVEASSMKQVAIDYLHPETKIENNDATLYGRNYYNRETAPQVLSNEDADERAQILADAIELKKGAANFSHPEAPVDVVATVFGRNYFTTRSDANVKMFSSSIEGAKAREDNHELFEFDDDYGQFTDMREQLKFINQPKKPFVRSASFANFAHNTIEVKEDEEGHLSRSPSCVAFFDFF